jgi:hypothetical protein
MKCHEFNNLALALADNRLLEAQLKGAALEHAAKCSLCAARLSAERNLTNAFRLTAEAERATAPARVKTALLQAFAAQNDGQNASNVVAFPAPAARRFRQWAVAAALLVSAALPAALLWRHNPATTAPVAITPAEKVETPAAPDTTGKPAPVVATAPAIRRVAAVKPPIVKVRHSSPPRLVAQTRRGRGFPPEREAAPAANETYKGFIALTYNHSDASEGGLVVRVNVPRSTLTAMGLPANAGGNGSEQVKADLLVGDDGVAKAVRFVSDTAEDAPKLRR